MSAEPTEIRNIFLAQRSKALELRNTSTRERIVKLKRLKNWIVENRIPLQKALDRDFQKPSAETDLTEYYLCIKAVDHAISHLRRWMRPKHVGTPLTLIGSSSQVIMEPKGVCLIMAPWNYPFNLVINPLISAIAAGNTAFLKPSEMTPNTSALVKKLTSELFEVNEVVTIEGGIEVSKELLTLPFDHIFFTGSPKVGKIVMEAASKNLSSVTLELGGKTPNIIDETANLQDAVEKITFNKFLNAGQTCIAPDYILVHEKVEREFLNLLKERIEQTYTQNQSDLAGIINEKHLNHLNNLLENALNKGARLVCGGTSDQENLRFNPTVLSNVKDDMQIMQKEIFGPLLPVVSFSTIEEAIDLINSKPKPLALYLFSKRRGNINKVLKSTSSGSVCINDGNVQFSNNYLPFGGVNDSGMGKAHGYYGFRAFSNEKAILEQRIGFTPLKLIYPPYTPRVKRIIDLLLRWL